jgi:hypothetical protein
MSYKEKYHKYKNKYLLLKKEIGMMAGGLIRKDCECGEYVKHIKECDEIRERNPTDNNKFLLLINFGGSSRAESGRVLDFVNSYDRSSRIPKENVYFVTNVMGLINQKTVYQQYFNDGNAFFSFEQTIFTHVIDTIVNKIINNDLKQCSIIVALSGHAGTDKFPIEYPYGVQGIIDDLFTHIVTTEQMKSIYETIPHHELIDLFKSDYELNKDLYSSNLFPEYFRTGTWKSNLYSNNKNYKYYEMNGKNKSFNLTNLGEKIRSMEYSVILSKFESFLNTGIYDLSLNNFEDDLMENVIHQCFVRRLIKNNKIINERKTSYNLDIEPQNVYKYFRNMTMLLSFCDVELRFNPEFKKIIELNDIDFGDTNIHVLHRPLDDNIAILLSVLGLDRDSSYSDSNVIKKLEENSLLSKSKNKIMLEQFINFHSTDKRRNVLMKLFGMRKSDKLSKFKAGLFVYSELEEERELTLPMFGWAPLSTCETTMIFFPNVKNDNIIVDNRNTKISVYNEKLRISVEHDSVNMFEEFRKYNRDTIFRPQPNKPQPKDPKDPNLNKPEINPEIEFFNFNFFELMKNFYNFTKENNWSKYEIEEYLEYFFDLYGDCCVRNNYFETLYGEDVYISDLC